MPSRPDSGTVTVPSKSWKEPSTLEMPRWRTRKPIEEWAVSST